MAKERHSNKSYGATLAALMLIPVLGCILIMPPSYMSRLLERERGWVYDIMGDTETECYQKALGAVTMDDLKSIAGLANEMGASKTKIEERVSAIWMWGTLIAYRIHIMMLWYIAGFGFLMGACCDGIMEWRIRQNQFRSQSPIRHYLGTRMTLVILIGVIVWMVLPVPMPAWIGAVLVVGSAGGIWVWLANLQKRL